MKAGMPYIDADRGFHKRLRKCSKDIDKVLFIIYNVIILN